MKTSEKIIEIAKALVLFQGKVKGVKKDSTNPHFKSKYASLEAIMEAIRKPLNESNLSIIQSQNVTRLLHISGEWIEIEVNLAPETGKPQEYGSAMTYARRYGVSAILSLATEDDDDGNMASQPKPLLAKPATVARQSTMDVVNASACPDCGASMKVSQQGKPYCSAICWQKGGK